ncbi:hypothetical protein AYK59_18155 [Pseudomonas synxantha]|uniref:Aldehyde dehydrogenase domain-containing protein n=2 Tax=Pseudomonas fluorescens group TaxID=136843 RepID=A0ABR5M8D7_9PSED|nr:MULTISPECIES: hypothetical protein [Pseudomonas]AKA80874.1 hypothetical protein VO64_0328 [Pseudomonas synxantha]AMS21965.1 hypothetical protein AYK59_18155 [Pseudomonas synxantha]KPG75194.1 hypothetical protein AEQ48_11440 [Pseudomonas libanensis]KRA06397.1 hypothetical protein ASD70_16040 [Pseudomonas sp. Root569]
MSKLPVLNWINGQWLDSGNYKDSIDPATYASIGQYAEGGLNEASLGIEAAQQAFGHSPW